MVRRKQAGSHVPKGKGRQNSNRKEVLRELAGHQQSPEPYLLSLRSSRVQQPSRGLWFGQSGTGRCKGRRPQDPSVHEEPSQQGDSGFLSPESGFQQQA